MKRSFLGLLVIVLLGSGCQMRFTPWDTHVSASMRHLTKKNLERLAKQEPSGERIVVGVISDPQGHPEDLARVVSKINARGVDFTLVLGDLTDYGLLQEYRWALAELNRLDNPYLTVIGNHDALSHGSKLYKEIFGAYDYSFTYGGHKFVMWNNNKYEFPDLDWNFLEREVDSELPTIIATHIPANSQDALNEADVERWRGINDEYGVLLNVAGHNHMYGYAIKEETAYYRVSDVKNVNFGVITLDNLIGKDSFSGPQVTVESCSPECRAE